MAAKGARRRIPLLCDAALNTGSQVCPAVLRSIGDGEVLLFAPIEMMPHLQLGGSMTLTAQLPSTSAHLRVPCTLISLEMEPDYLGADAISCRVQIGTLDKGRQALLDALYANFRETVLIVDDELEGRVHVADALAQHFHVLSAASGAEALALFAENEIAVVIVDEKMPEMDGVEFMRQLAARVPGNHAVKLVLSSVADPEAMQRFIAKTKIFYFLTKPVPSGDLLAVVQSAVEHYREGAAPRYQVNDQFNALRTKRILELSRTLGMQRDLATAGQLAIEAVEELLSADRALYYIYDSISETLWTRGDRTQDGHPRSAIAGLAGFASRTGASVALECANNDPRYRREIDDPNGEGNERLLLEPLLTPDRRTLAVLIAVRAARRPPFSREEIDTFRLLAGQCASAFGQMSMQAQVEEVFTDREAAVKPATPFRNEALETYVLAEGGSGQVLRISPAWAGYVYQLLVVVMVSAVVYALVGNIDEYATGPAIVRIDGRSDLTATSSAIVASVQVQPGQRVEAKQLLVRFYDAQESTQLERIKKEFDFQLIKVLRNPADPVPRESLGKLRAERDFALAQLEERSIRAPHSGVVNDVRIRAGQHLPVGAPILSITPNDSTLSIVALIPGQYRPMVRNGQKLRLEISGFRYAYRELTVETIGDEVVGPEEARRYLGQEVADSVQLVGPVILVRAKLPTPTFNSEGRVFSYHDGMHGTAEVRVRTEPILLALVPGLSALFGETR